MSPLIVVAWLAAVTVLSLLTSYGRIRWFGRKFHRAIAACEAVGSVSFVSWIFVFGWQTDSVWRPVLLGVTGLLWLFTAAWSAQINKAQKLLSAPKGKIV